MAIFDRFRRNRQQSVLPDEVKQYYQTENRQRRGMAAVLAIGALLATVAVAAALFFGGRFIYDKIHDDGTETTQTADENKDNGKKPENERGTDQPSGGSTDTPAAPAPATDTPAATPAAPPTSTPSNPETSSPAAPAPQATPPLGDTSLPHTGDEGM